MSRRQIRPFEERDVDELLDVWYRASIVAHAFLPDEFFERERSQLVDTWLPIADTTVFEKDGRVAGFLSLVGNEVGAVFVDPDAQRSGIGAALIEHARARRPYLVVEVFEQNRTGRAFYQRQGFELVARRIEENTGRPLLRLRLQ